MKARLTKRTIDALESKAREYIAWDTRQEGFGLRVFPSGRKSFVVQYQSKRRTKRITLGTYGVLTPAKALQMAQDTLAEVRGGKDPSAERKRALRAPTVAALAERYMEAHVIPKKKPLAARSDESNLRLYILPAIGRLKVEDVTRRDIAELHHQMRHIPIAANRCLATLSKMFALAELWDLREGNPARCIPHYRENRRNRFLSEAEMARVGEVLRTMEREGTESPFAIAAIRLLALTGARRGEILNLRWDYVDLEAGLLRLPDSKTGAKVIALNAPAIQILENLRKLRGESPWVIQGPDPMKALHTLWKPWQRVRKAAKVEDVRIHDLRHSHASFGASVGLSLPVIGALLGHRSPATTARYAHLANDPMRRGSEMIGSRIAAALEGRELGEVVPLRGHFS